MIHKTSSKGCAIGRPCEKTCQVFTTNFPLQNCSRLGFVAASHFNNSLRSLAQPFLEKPSFKRGLNISLNKGFDFGLMDLEHQGFSRELEGVEGIEVCSLEDLNPEDFKFGKEDYFSLFNSEKSDEVLFLRVREGADVEKTLLLDYFDIAGKFVSNIFILAGRNSKAKVVLKWKSKGRDYCGANVRVLVCEGSEVEIVSVYDFSNAEVAQRKFGRCLAGGRVNWKEIVLGGGIVLSDVQNFLEGENAKSDVKCVFISKGKEIFDLNAEVFHNSSLTESEIFFRGVCLDSSQSISRGLIRIGENAKDCKGYEKHDVLLLGDDCEADAIPQLEILNDEVQCSHGTSIGKIDEDSVFYLMSRGLSNGEAELEILKGYLSFVGDDLGEELIQEIYKKLADSVVL